MTKRELSEANYDRHIMHNVLAALVGSMHKQFDAQSQVFVEGHEKLRSRLHNEKKIRDLTQSREAVNRSLKTIAY